MPVSKLDVYHQMFKEVVTGKTSVGSKQWTFETRPGLTAPTIAPRGRRTIIKPINSKPFMKPRALGDAPAASKAALPPAPDDMPFLSTWALTNKDKTMMFAWWDAIKEWQPKHPEIKLQFPDLDKLVTKYQDKPNYAVDKWLEAMAKSVPQDYIDRGETAIDPRWLTLEIDLAY